MDKRYQVFVSSTYADLKEERQKVIQTLMEMDCIPSGMEIFPAADEEQLEFIKKIIDDCDYYILIIGGRYGSTNPKGVSYTEKEYDYAVEKGIKVIALLHENPDLIPAGKTEKNEEMTARLNTFRDKVKEGRIVKFWNEAKDLPGIVALSLTKTIKTHPAVGWVRANLVGKPELLNELNELRKENEVLQLAQKSLKTDNGPKIKNLAGLDEIFKIEGDYKGRRSGITKRWEMDLSWREIYYLISPSLLSTLSDYGVQSVLEKAILSKQGYDTLTVDIDDQIFQTIKIQFMTLSLVNINYLKTTAGDMLLFWSFTKKGKDLMMEIRSVKTNKGSK